jgi:hypothetical protein
MSVNLFTSNIVRPWLILYTMSILHKLIILLLINSIINLTNPGVKYSKNLLLEKTRILKIAVLNDNIYVCFFLCSKQKLLKDKYNLFVNNVTNVN